METKVAYLKQKDYTTGLNSKIWLDFKLEKTDDEILLEKTIEMLTEDEGLWIVFLAQTYYAGEYLDEVNYLRNKYKSVEECFDKEKCPLGGDNYEAYNSPYLGISPYFGINYEIKYGYKLSEELYEHAVKNKTNV